MSNKRSKEILEEMLAFSVAVIRYAKDAKPYPAISDQLIRSSSSIGANYSEAQDAGSRRDFLHKIYIAKKEAAETVYWLKLLYKLSEGNKDLATLEIKAHSLLLLLQKIVNSTRSSL